MDVFTPIKRPVITVIIIANIVDYLTNDALSGCFIANL